MGGHGELNILPQKRWNVYNYENRKKGRKDEEAAAKEEQLKREQARKRYAEFRLVRLRTALGLAPLKSWRFRACCSACHGACGGLEKGGAAEKDGFKRKKLKKEEVAPKVVAPEDEKYRLGYGIAGKGVKLSWYLKRRNVDVEEESGNNGSGSERVQKDEGRKTRKKTVQELREERLKKERRKKEREKALLIEKSKTDRALKIRKFSRR
ncbi:hypothetical protein CRYUN_Cryun13aG0134700 [Craigia yunnanensis]